MKRLARLGVVGASIVSAGCLTVGMGVASADTIVNTGPGSYNAILTRSSFNQTVRNVNNVRLNNQNFQTAITGSASVTGNTNGNGGNNNNKCNYDKKTSYKPSNYMRNMYAMMPSHYYQVPKHNNQYSNNTPSYSGNEYGNNNYGNSNEYGNNNYGNSHEYGNNNSGGQGGSAVTGNASNYNATQASVDVANTTPTLSNMDTNTVGNNTISDTGPHSFNLISSKSTSNVEVTNNNHVDITNNNMQTAVSGNANVSGNTRGGSAITGNATNTNRTDIEVAIDNN